MAADNKIIFPRGTVTLAGYWSGGGVTYDTVEATCASNIVDGSMFAGNQAQSGGAQMYSQCSAQVVFENSSFAIVPGLSQVLRQYI